MRVLRRYLSAVLEQNAVSIPLDPRKYGISVGLIADRKLIGTSAFYLAVAADLPAESIRRHFPARPRSARSRKSANWSIRRAGGHAAPHAGGAAPDPLSRRGGLFRT
jgi:hypothetical protein